MRSNWKAGAGIVALNAHYGWARFRAPGKKQHYASRYRMPMHANSLRYAAQAAR